eukprot:TRINITY_DN82197_c0_g1_i1.p1 TRINITY_DN82197_c0_g1~~TRINITY_DN82197_c0_g1_i1.p1  ORF type:complete len:358 (+),score=93.12 TRINITY_DN82197_c0_g1_i1:122-1195(+)
MRCHQLGHLLALRAIFFGAPPPARAVRLAAEDGAPVPVSLREADDEVKVEQTERAEDVEAFLSRPQLRRVGSDLEQRGEKLQQRYYKKELVQQLRCVDCVALRAKRDYTITEGSLLGAARGGFFIPWDSDGDVSFDVRNAAGEEDPEGFYNLFSEANAKQRQKDCPHCGDVVLAHFTPDIPNDEGKPPLWHWQTIDAIRSGNLLEASGYTYHRVPDEVRGELLEKLKGRIDSRLFWNKPYVYGGGPYVDLEPFYVDSNSGRWKNLAIETPSEEAMPFQRCSLAHFDEASVNNVELSCPKKPAAFLEKYYGANWKQEPYNAFEDGKWSRMDAGPALHDFLLKSSKGFHGALKPVEDRS